jgi:hypothetical protein
MSTINIQLPAVEGDQQIEVEVKVNGKKRRLHYRIEIFSWEECEKIEERAECLKKIISKYDKDWRLINIGSPTETHIPLMFKQMNAN